MNTARIFLVAALWLSVCNSSGQTNSILDPDTNKVSQYYQEVYQTATWGSPTNDIQFGVHISSIGPSSADKFQVFTFLNNTGSSNLYGLWKPSHGSRLDISLKGKDGKEVTRTKAGNALCKTSTKNLNRSGSIVILHPYKPTRFDDHFDLQNCFKLAKPGSYDLTVKARLYSLKASPDYVPFDLPEVRIEVVLSDADLER